MSATCYTGCVYPAAATACGSIAMNCLSTAHACATSGCVTSCTGACTVAASACNQSGCGQGCATTCTGSCFASCTDNCNNGCTGGDYTTAYANLAFSALIKSSEILQLKNMIINETTRRGYTASNPNAESIETKALATTIQAMYDNISNAILKSTSVSAPSIDYVAGDKMTSAGINEYLTAAKNLYLCVIPGSTTT